jgi:hypothetical protein
MYMRVFSCDSDAIQFLKYDEIPLAPKAAYVGLDIWAVGSECGGQVNANYIAGGFVAPEYVIQVADK